MLELTMGMEGCCMLDPRGQEQTDHSQWHGLTKGL